MDIGLSWDPAKYRGDWTCTSGDLAIDPGGLRTAVILSLFTDRVAAPDYVAPAGSPQGRRGWWGDSYETTPIGSRLWQLNRSVKSGSVALLNQATDICNEALQWLVDAGIVASVTVTCAWLNTSGSGSSAIGIQIVITQPQSPPTTFNFGFSWQGA